MVNLELLIKIAYGMCVILFFIIIIAGIWIMIIRDKILGALFIRDNLMVLLIVIYFIERVII